MQDTGYRIQDTGYRIQDTGCRIQDAGCGIKDAGYGVQDDSYQGVATISKAVENETIGIDFRFFCSYFFKYQSDNLSYKGFCSCFLATWC
jgi:hypothetical protein